MGIPIAGGFAGVKDTGFTALPKNDYTAVVEDAELTEVKEETAAAFAVEHPGEEHPGYIKWTFAIVEPEEYDNRKVWHNTSLYGDGLSMLKNVLQALGFDAEELNNPDFNLDLDNDPRIKGAKVTLKAGPDRKDDTQTKVRAVLAYEETGLLPS